MVLILQKTELLPCRGDCYLILSLAKGFRFTCCRNWAGNACRNLQVLLHAAVVFSWILD